MALIDHQMRLLELEIQTINSSIRQMDDIVKSIKQWTITVWTAAVGITLASPVLTDFTVAVSIIPLVFLFVEVSYRRIQRRFIWRSERIGDFINDGGLASAIERGRISSEFFLWDPAAVRTSTRDYLRFIGIRTIMQFQSVGVFYFGLAFLTVLVAWVRE